MEATTDSFLERKTFAALTPVGISPLPKVSPHGKCNTAQGPLLSCWDQAVFAVGSSQWYSCCLWGKNIYFYLTWWSINHLPGLQQLRAKRNPALNRKYGPGTLRPSSEAKRPTRRADGAEAAASVSVHLKEGIIIIKINFTRLSSSPGFKCCKRITVISASNQHNNTNNQWRLWFPAVHLLPGQLSFWVSVSKEHGF